MTTKKILTFVKTNAFFQGSVLFTAANFFAGFLNYLFNALTAKTLGPVGYSEVTALFAYLAVITIPLVAVSTDIIRRLGSMDDNKIQTLAKWEGWVWKKINERKYLLFLYFLLVLIVPRLTNLSFSASIALLTLFLFAPLTDFYLGAFQGLHWFAVFSMVVVATVAVKLLGAVLVYFHRGGLNLLLLCLIMSGFVPILVGKTIIARATKRAKKKSKIITTYNKRLIHVVFNRHLVITTFSLICINLLNNMDVIFVKKSFMAQEAGVYGAWSLFGKIILFCVGPLNGVALVFFASHKFKKYHRLSIWLSLAVLAIIGVFFYLVYSYWGAFLLALFFNEKYRAILVYLPEAAIFGILYTSIFVMNNFLLVKNSLLSLLSVVLAPLYFLVLVMYGDSPSSVIYLNVLFSIGAFFAYLMCILYYNTRPWKTPK